MLASITLYLYQKLKLKVNAVKGAVDRPWKRSFLGYSMTWHKRPRRVHVVEAIPRNAMGKVLKASLASGGAR